MSLPVAQYPNITPSTIQVTATYPGADAETLQKTVVQPLEAQINGVKGMMYISSVSSDNGQATITVTFPAGSDGDINTVNVQNRANLAIPQLPQEVQAQGLVIKERSSNMLIIIDLLSPSGTYDEVFLSNYINLYIKDEIARIPGVGDTAILGAANYSMRVWLDADKMANLKITVSDIVNAIKAQNVQVSAGALGDEPTSSDQVFRYTVQTQGRLADAEEFEDVVLRALPDGSSVRIKDVARIELGAENYNQSSKVNGKQSAKLIVYQLPEGNGLQIATECRARIEELKKKFPKDVEYVVLYDTTKFIKASIDEVVKTLFEAILLVVLVTYLFMQDWRAAAVPTIAIPVSLIGTFAAMLAMGYSINLITLFGLILAIGIVVDDAIVVIENVNHLMEKEGLPPKEAAKKTMLQVTGPVVATTLVLLAMFIPVCFLPGITGEMYRQFGVTISVSVLISAVNALTLSPALSAVFLRPSSHNSFEKNFFVFKWFNFLFDRTTNGYTRVVGSLVRKAFLVLLAYAGMTFVAYKIYGMIPTGFIPEEDQGAFFVNVQLPDGAAAPRTAQVVDTATEMMRKVPGVTDVMSVNGYSIINSTTASNNAFLVGILDDWSKRQTEPLKVNAILDGLAGTLKSIPGAVVFPFQLPAIPGLGASGGFAFVIEDTTGLDPQRLEQAANALIIEANKRPELQQVYTTFRATVPRIFLKIDRDKAFKMGVALEDINTTLKGMQGYLYVNDFNKFGKVYKVELQAEKEFRSELDDFNGVHVRNSSDEMVPLSTLVEVETRFGPQYINRYNLYSSVTINGNAAAGFSSGQAMKAMEELADKTLPAGMKYEWTDMSYQERLAAGKTSVVFALALLFIYLFLVAQYESWMIPTSVILSVPIALLGALLFLLARDIDNNIYTQVGFVLLFGLACKTAILIVEFAKEKREGGMSIEEAAVSAARLRFRAVLMTSIAFVLGVLPLVAANGAGAISRQSLGSVICGGMIVSAVFGTILVPVFFAAIQKTIELLSSKGETKRIV